MSGLQKRLNHLREIEQTFINNGNAECADIYHGAVTELEITLKDLGDYELERDQLRAQVVRLREALMTYHNISVPLNKLRLEDFEQFEQILKETPSDSAKALLGPTVELLKEAFTFMKETHPPADDFLSLGLEKEIQRLERLMKP